ncbi:GNAT family N-acetyltransferase [Aeromicrobium wangtongii]|uniref:GNAT family N-acetyltransferase n=1 Tax=Aeromicrobium wangtongii TaxID=2969247 RepID=A0ABY5M7R9_9ACTN|nr:GNAT family N-acetyltransferase [Aeromicrobium wangtongii]MCD9198826.1 GNAT family N-acetyltransferase [Aeromicrobium wangtongii]UUP13134.1 GNAT family N-acetyltransferase [Aeromicrobium wangtongii]
MTITVVNVADQSSFDELYDVYGRSLTRPFDDRWLAIEKRVNLTDDAYGTKVAVVARDGDGLAIGGGWVTLPLQDNTDVAFVDVFTVPERRREAIGSRMLDELVGIARAHGRTKAFAMPVWAVDADGDAGRWFAEARGFELDFMDAVRELRLPADLPPLAVAPGYTLETWRGPCPDEWVDEYADLRRIMNSEAPSGDAGLENEHWDVARVRKDEADLVRVGRQMQIVVARAPDNELAGHTQLAFPADGTEVYQWDTLVRPADRGHGLGLALKIRAMQVSGDLLAGRRRVTTYNAATNTHMIAVNEKLGFRQTAWAGEYILPI